MSSAPAPAGRAVRRALDVDALLADPAVRIVVCCGSGGVGKTTTSAALAVRAAEQGRRVAVLTIDPARRLAQSLGVQRLDNAPRPVRGVDTAAGGSLDAMMLDMKRTFDEVVTAHATPEKAAQILDNGFYQALSSSFAGTQEYMAMEKLSQLHTEALRTGRWDIIVVDTPPSRSALDFLDAPARLASFLDGRLIRLLLAPTRGPLRLLTAGFSLVSMTIGKVLGGQLLGEIQTFVAAFDTLFGGFRARAESTYQILRDPQTAFLVMAVPAADAIREATFFLDRLTADGIAPRGLVLNRVTADLGGAVQAA
ncbi:MAG: ArsA family ATPase, partial [Sciscionella sp.]